MLYILVVGFRISGIIIYCGVSLSVVFVGVCLSDVGSRAQTTDCQVSLSLVVVCSWSSNVAFQVLVVACQCWLSIIFPIGPSHL
jgi:hypothetical protein